MHAKAKGLMWLGIATTVAGAMALGIPFAAKGVPWAWEATLARHWHPFPDDELCQLPPPAMLALQMLLDQTQSADELAGVLAHEIEHVKRRHIVQGAFTQLLTVGIFSVIFQNGRLDTRTAEMLLHMKFSRLQESEADEGGFQRLKDAGINTDGVESFFNRMEAMSSTPAILSDHPASAERARLAESFKPKNPTPILTPPEWLALRKACR